mmetsp:Transcript_5785/g.11463  ORF Transcript_5785/g.11463 Transcript_5785/m.11463 type:complete len:395 (-) Transcript_5785:2867-4051(-)
MCEPIVAFLHSVPEHKWIDNPHDGNCLYNAVIDCLAPLGIHETVKTMRTKMAAFLRLRMHRVMSGLATSGQIQDMEFLFSGIMINGLDPLDETFGFLRRRVLRIKPEVRKIIESDPHFLKDARVHKTFRTITEAYAERLEKTKLWASQYEVQAMSELYPTHVSVIKLMENTNTFRELFYSTRIDAKDSVIVLGNYNNKHYMAGGIDTSKVIHTRLIQYIRPRWPIVGATSRLVDIVLEALEKIDPETRPHLRSFTHLEHIGALSKALHDYPKDTPLRRHYIKKVKEDKKDLIARLRTGMSVNCAGLVNAKPFYILGNRYKDAKHHVAYSESSACQIFHKNDEVECLYSFETRPMRKITRKLLKRKKWKKMKKLSKKVKKTLQKRKENNEPMPAE